MAKKSPVKETILQVLQEKGCMTKDELAEEVANRVGTMPRVVKAVITKMVKRGELVEKDGKICLP